MKLNIETKVLCEVLRRIHHLPGAAGAIIYTQIVKLTADMNGLNVLRFSNAAKISATAEETVVVQDEGTIRVSYDELYKYAQQMPGEKTLIFAHGEHLFLSSGNFKFKLPQIVEDLDMEPTPDELETTDYRVPIDDLHHWLSSVAVAMGRDGTKEMLRSISVRPWNQQLSFAATDTKIVLIRMTDYQFEGPPITIPTSGVEMILKAIEKQEGACTLALGMNSVRITGSNIEVTASLFTDPYPDMNRIMDKTTSSIQSKMSIPRLKTQEGFRTLSKAINVIALLTVNKDRNEMLASSRTTTGGSALATLSCVSSADGIFGINPDRFADLLGFLNADSDGNVNLTIYTDGTAAVYQDDRLGFAVLSKPPKVE